MKFQPVLKYGKKEKALPRYVEHKQSGRGRVIYYNAAGKRQEQLLPGAFNSKESVAAFGRFLLEQEVAPKEALIAKDDGEAKNRWPRSLRRTTLTPNAITAKTGKPPAS